MTTGFVATTNIPLNPDLITLSVISFTILALAAASSSLVCPPGYCARPAVITTISASLHSS